MSDVLPLNSKIRFGAMTTAANREHALKTVSTLAEWGYEGIWTGDHVAFTGPVDDPLTELTYLSALNPNLIYGTSIYLLAAAASHDGCEDGRDGGPPDGRGTFHFRRRRWR